ncbi:hypothetical protein GLYMA_02G293000v4 [Glycine max]|uniref:Uncharacterized protein n=1 Tax=Glycine max TaxID=3847 RepID=K7KBH0_SOYBN|nr:uncharacterized protein LOC102662647 [Glycine max]KRH73779.1 hypothetical protein GLYMA_02G293000v4 [Glycine max]|eukprot:XP_006575681.1 uncharacterized protein LOC102662647 [Glycine max]
MNRFNKSELLVLFVLPLSGLPTFTSSLTFSSLHLEPKLLFSQILLSLSVTQKPLIPPELYEPEERVEVEASEHDEKKPKVVAKSASDENIVGHTEVKKCPSIPNLLLIGCGESEGDVIEAEDEARGVNGQELFAKAEAFIGNF